MYAKICLLLSPILIARPLTGVSGCVFAPSSVTADRSKDFIQHNFYAILYGSFRVYDDRSCTPETIYFGVDFKFDERSSA